MPGLLVPGLFPVGGRVGSGSGSLLHKMGGGSSLLSPVPSESQALEEWWAHLSHVQSCLLGPGVGPLPGQQRGRGGPPPGVPAGPMGSKDEQQHRSAGAPGPGPEATAA